MQIYKRKIEKFIILFFLFLSFLFAQNKEAYFYRKIGKDLVQCFLCPKNCIIQPGKYGFCRARKNIDGTLYAMGYSSPCSVAIDPIEKKPFFHYLPGTPTFSIASAGCSLRCKFCQNWEISQVTPEETKNVYLTPEKVVEYAIKYKCPSIAYTYSEPMNFYEYMFDIAKIAKSKGIKNIMHTAGFINPEPLENLCKYIDAANVDLKGFNNEFYRNICEGELEVILNTLKILKKNKIWIEITNLIIPGYNDKPEEIKNMCIWIKNNLGESTPLHFSRFYPRYLMLHIPSTPVETLEKAVKIAKEVGLKYVYIGNVENSQYENTYCSGCGKILIKRRGFFVLENNIIDGKCKFCKTKVEGVWK
ncbi:MAG: AmmeMemoRadiSam system radical SAM enzyme [Candidatus Omnitrophica bacterium]|nr:AmmeMemoRadiSam system radical SAM enzyme [Candidatus Omnitrophota bacterium]MCM8803173.1 AmmeMemoRadiSam system radical SAM enzyme [Candidatus Omnitrophota bacterium]